MAAAYLIAASHVWKAYSEIPLSTHAIVQAETMVECNGIRYAPFRQIVRQR